MIQPFQEWEAAGTFCLFQNKIQRGQINIFNDEWKDQQSLFLAIYSHINLRKCESTQYIAKLFHWSYWYSTLVHTLYYLAFYNIGSMNTTTQIDKNKAICLNLKMNLVNTHSMIFSGQSMAFQQVVQYVLWHHKGVSGLPAPTFRSKL